jgi:hypothetical protein
VPTSFFEQNTAFLYINFISIVNYYLHPWESNLKVTQRKGTEGAPFLTA